ncbi:tryptophan synthase subunit alpha [Dehalococcoides mccartyi]|jgi:tryptophan synthase alpha chain|uniref:Tryptophan synthase alpha chain n=1 Tax=Dehalococcoides mccartyi TaxID=61435 RepID=A0A142VBB7_9CHLR|nr:tryptophan synthase subunit alpha [Dehalococcoides mccartyi]AII61423.1 tryptophan synthase subunit alpha [Dehalococcoides mccartyi CG5]AMU87130.1 tryptophan synthase subunit alpha [Dehalococcoides mccartyi]AOV99912.1 tryptophan synthase alpha chain [Dehalococcoides mccartyi]MBA2085695.1 Tryptophan synthase alpha chain [Dehalococcoides mccartyi]QBX64428.1 tryptophan synthase subunit alpha [Dehalococcoides mccartyi]
MSRVSDAFQKRKSLIAYITVGYPDIETTLRLVPLLEENGVDIIELGIPFSDPLADGVTIQNASYQALQNGVTPEVCLSVAALLKEKISIPMVFMGYYNPIYNYGLTKFCQKCATAGVSGFIIPDLPPGEAQDIDFAATEAGLDIIFLLAPTSTDERIKLVAAKSRGFIYLVSHSGVTGATANLPADLSSFVNRVRKTARQPLAVGFGISTPEQAQNISKFSDGIIVGSRILQLVQTDPSLEKVATFIRQLRQSLD